MNAIYHKFAFSDAGSHHTQNSCFTKAGQEYSDIVPSPLNVLRLTDIMFRRASLHFKKKFKQIKIMGFVIPFLHVVGREQWGTAAP